MWRKPVFAAFLIGAALLCGALVVRPGLAQAVDYADPANWAARPGFENASMRVPDPRLRNRQASARADVFYVYPTIHVGLFSLNADISDPGYRRDVARYLLTSQASALNNVGRIYAPFYRQVGFGGYLRGGAALARALDLAYGDVRAAFEHYLERDNRGRPLIILAHSQGAALALRLLRDYENDPRLVRRLVVAYLIGERIGTEDTGAIGPCRGPRQTGCFVTWASVTPGASPSLVGGEPRGRPVCINPLSWRMDERAVPPARHLGGVPDSFDRIEPRLVHARCRDGLLEIWPAPEGYAHLGGDYHLSDIGLFYMDLRANAAARVAQFMR